MSFTPKIDNTQLAHGGNRVYAVVVRHKVLKRVKDFFETNNIGNDGLLYKPSYKAISPQQKFLYRTVIELTTLCAYTWDMTKPG